jgi:hypothetical protein
VINHESPSHSGEPKQVVWKRERERAEDASPGGVGVSSAVSPGGQRFVRHVQGGGAGHLGVPPASKPDVYKNRKSTIGWGVGKC